MKATGLFGFTNKRHISPFCTADHGAVPSTQDKPSGKGKSDETLVTPNCSNLFLLFNFSQTEKVKAEHPCYAATFTTKSNGGQQFQESISNLNL